MWPARPLPSGGEETAGAAGQLPPLATHPPPPLFPSRPRPPRQPPRPNREVTGSGAGEGEGGSSPPAGDRPPPPPRAGGHPQPLTIHGVEGGGRPAGRPAATGRGARRDGGGSHATHVRRPYRARPPSPAPAAARHHRAAGSVRRRRRRRHRCRRHHAAGARPAKGAPGRQSGGKGEWARGGKRGGPVSPCLSWEGARRGRMWWRGRARVDHPLLPLDRWQHAEEIPATRLHSRRARVGVAGVSSGRPPRRGRPSTGRRGWHCVPVGGEQQVSAAAATKPGW